MPRAVEEMMLQRGVVVSYETIRRWCDKFGQDYATGHVAAVLAPATSGTSTRYSFGSTARLLNRDEEHAFWAWAVVAVLRHTGVFSGGRPLQAGSGRVFAELGG